MLDWTVPDEWNIRDAYIATADGRRVVDFGESNLHIVSYSENVRKTMTLKDLMPYLHVHPERPDWIPYRTSYYNRNWGVCLSRNQLEALEDGTYEVVIDGAGRATGTASRRSSGAGAGADMAGAASGISTGSGGASSMGVS